jgi:hypothetical protein
MPNIFSGRKKILKGGVWMVRQSKRPQSLVLGNFPRAGQVTGNHRLTGTRRLEAQPFAGRPA